MIFDINGEYGYELFAALPLVNYYHEQGEDVVVNAPIGSSLLYPNIKVNEVYSSRHSFLKVDINGESYYRPHNHIAGCFSKPIVGDKLMWEDKWSPPNLKEHYKSQFELEFDKPALVVSNKIQNEWGNGPTNYLDISTLKQIFESVSGRFTIIYNRPRPRDIVNDETPQLKFDDAQLCREYGVIEMQDLANEFNMDYNQTQMIVYANSEHFISTQGGNSALAAYFGGQNIIYGIRGYEVKWNAYSTFFPKLSNQKIHHETTYDGVIEKLENYVK